MSGKIVYIGAFLFVLFSSVFISGKLKDGGGVYKAKNLQVLPKDISHDELEKIMHTFNDALGVECSHCHVTNSDGEGLNFVSDDNPIKETARIMMRMTNRINKKHFKHNKKTTSYSQISCISCHHGSTSVPMEHISR